MFSFSLQKQFKTSMTILIKKIGNKINRMLTFINAFLLAVVTGNVSNPKEIQNIRIPIIANIFLLVFLGLGLFAAIYKINS